MKAAPVVNGDAVTRQAWPELESMFLSDCVLQLDLRSGSLVGLDRQSGTLRWMHVDRPSEEVVAKKAEWGFAAGPLLLFLLRRR